MLLKQRIWLSINRTDCRTLVLQELDSGVRLVSLPLWCSCIFSVEFIDFNSRHLFHAKQAFFLLVLSYESSHRWSTYTLITHFIALLFILVLIALDANAVTPYNNQLSSAPVKIQILKAQLAVAVLLLFCPLSFLGAYIYTAFMSLFPFRPHTESVYPPLPIRSPKVGFWIVFCVWWISSKFFSERTNQSFIENFIAKRLKSNES